MLLIGGVTKASCRNIGARRNVGVYISEFDLRELGSIRACCLRPGTAREPRAVPGRRRFSYRNQGLEPLIFLLSNSGYIGRLMPSFCIFDCRVVRFIPS